MTLQEILTELVSYRIKVMFEQKFGELEATLYFPNGKHTHVNTMHGNIVENLNHQLGLFIKESEKELKV